MIQDYCKICKSYADVNDYCLCYDCINRIKTIIHVDDGTLNNFIREYIKVSDERVKKILENSFIARLGEDGFHERLLNIKKEDKEKEEQELIEKEQLLKEQQAEEQKKRDISSILIATTDSIPGFDIKNYVDYINIDFLVSIVSGGLNTVVDDMQGLGLDRLIYNLSDLKNRAILEAKEKAYNLGANAIVSVKTNHVVFSYFHKYEISGTAVIAKKRE